MKKKYVLFMLETLVDKNRLDVEEVNSVIIDVICNSAYTNNGVYEHLAENIDKISSSHASIILEELKRCNRL